ncbi:hypothetical protein [Nocardiopsis tropica]|uniref:Uncharacterized protein n=1 Tax=Nocardiopsis tropica TaxID=109330 RepID=A0ABU7KLE1_9ACTN|nr:hypothetical protein [Nocardiopsis umidischolae]MEE2050101.1 hypothetical protein [Nocardiopsis umidischolae]
MRMIERPIPREYLFFTPAALGQQAHEGVCGLLGLKATDTGYGVLLLESAASGQHAGFLTADVAWIQNIAEVQRRAQAGQITAEAARLDLSPQVLSTKVAAIFQGWPDESSGEDAARPANRAGAFSCSLPAASPRYQRLPLRSDAPGHRRRTPIAGSSRTPAVPRLAGVRVSPRVAPR